jgi:hypothetical protein
VSCGSITDASVSRLSNVDDLKGVILYDVVLSEPAIATLRASKPNATVMVNGDSE